MEPVRLTPYVTHQLWTTNHNSNTIIYYQSYANQSVLTPNGGEVHKAYVLRSTPQVCLLQIKIKTSIVPSTTPIATN